MGEDPDIQRERYRINYTKHPIITMLENLVIDVVTREAEIANECLKLRRIVMREVRKVTKTPITRTIRRKSPTLEKLTPAQQQMFLSFYLTKGIIYSDGFCLQSPKVFWLTQTAGLPFAKNKCTFANSWLLEITPQDVGLYEGKFIIDG